MLGKMAFIHAHQFSIHFRYDLGSPGCTAPLVDYPGRSDRPGTVIEISSVPKECPHEVVSVFNKTKRKLHVELLSPDHVHRKGQAYDRFMNAIDLMMNKFPSLQGLPHSGKQYSVLMDESKDQRRQLEMANKAAAEAGVQSSTQRVKANDDDDDVCGDERAQPKKGKGGGRGQKRPTAPGALPTTPAKAVRSDATRVPKRRASPLPRDSPSAAAKSLRGGSKAGSVKALHLDTEDQLEKDVLAVMLGDVRRPGCSLHSAPPDAYRLIVVSGRCV